MIEPSGISIQEARDKVLSGSAVFVCAHEDDEMFRKMRLKGSISFNDFKNMSASLSRDREIIFYH